jgi:putative ABC transport system permease protein
MVMNNNFGNLIVKTKNADVAELLATIKTTYDSLNPELPFSSSFLDERINNTYQIERKTGYLLGLFTGLTIFVACLGLFGLATFTANQRTKEIGIRQVLGASEVGIVQLLVKDFIKLIVISLVIASPIAWSLMNKWLSDFAYRIEIQWWVFLLAGFVAVFIAIMTVSWQALRAAMANPVKSLREE